MSGFAIDKQVHVEKVTAVFELRVGNHDKHPSPSPSSSSWTFEYSMRLRSVGQVRAGKVLSNRE